jgi:hypothetical protein
MHLYVNDSTVINDLYYYLLKGVNFIFLLKGVNIFDYTSFYQKLNKNNSDYTSFSFLFLTKSLTALFYNLMVILF